MLTKKYYELIADVIARAPWTDDEWGAHKALSERFADMCERDNPKFNRARFLKACGVQS